MLAPAELRGRVLSSYFLSQGLMPLGSLLAGALTSLFSGPWAVTAMGESCLLLVVGIAISVPDLWKLNLISGHQKVNPESEEVTQ